MSKLALYGGRPALPGPIARFNEIGGPEQTGALLAMHGTLSGFLGGEPEGGNFVQLLEREWSKAFRIEHCVSVNSATSGLLAAAHAIGLGPDDEFIVSPYTMSATAAAPMLLGAKPVFVDIEPQWCNLDIEKVSEAITPKTKAVFVTNLFGHPAQLRELRTLCHDANVFLIEDNAQSPFATEDGRYTGTIGNIGVYSLNIHKHIQCGEGGLVVTRDDKLADRLKEFRNHGEMAGGGVGLNLRMTEVTAAIAVAQLRRSREIIAGRIRQAEALSSITRSLPIKPIANRKGCVGVYYHWVFELDLFSHRDTDRSEFCKAALAEGVPLNQGYVEPLYKLPAFQKYHADCPVAEDKYNSSLIYFENCGYSLTDTQIEQVGDAFRKICYELFH